MIAATLGFCQELNGDGEQQRGRSTGLEPATFGTTIQRSNQLSYDRHGKKWLEFNEELIFWSSDGLSQNWN